MRYCNEEREGIEPSLLFFFLILVLIFCKPGIVGCGNDHDCCERDMCEPVCEPTCGC